MIYVEEFDRLPVLTHQQHKELFARYKQHGDIEARNKIVESIIKLAVKTVNKYPMLERFREDVLSEAMMKLVIAIDNWDGKRPLVKFFNAILFNVCTTKWSNLNLVYMNPSTARQANKTLEFSTAEEIATNCKVSLKRAREIMSARAVMGLSSYQAWDDDLGRIKDREEQEDCDQPCLADLEPLVEQLPERERKVFSLRAGLHGKRATAPETGKRLGLTPSEVNVAMRASKVAIKRMVLKQHGSAGKTEPCGFCGKPFVRGSSVQKYCSLLCQSRNRYKKVPQLTQ